MRLEDAPCPACNERGLCETCWTRFEWRKAGEERAQARRFERESYRLGLYPMTEPPFAGWHMPANEGGTIPF